MRRALYRTGLLVRQQPGHRAKEDSDENRRNRQNNTIGAGNEAVNVDDVIETAPHFRCI